MLMMNMGEMQQGRREGSGVTDVQQTGMLLPAHEVLEPVLSVSLFGRRAEDFIFHLNQPGLFSEL